MSDQMNNGVKVSGESEAVKVGSSGIVDQGTSVKTETTQESPNLDVMSAAEIKALYEKQMAEKNAPKADEKAVVENKVAEVKNEEVKKPEVNVETAKDVKPETDIRSVISEVLEEKFKELGVKEEAVEKPEDKFFGFKSQEELDSAYASDPAGTTRSVVEAAVKELVQKQIRAEIEPFKKQIAPVTERMQQETINNHQKEAFESVPELKDPNSPMSKDFQKFLADKANHELINHWANNGENPLLRVAKLVRAERLGDYINSAKEQGIKEGEERSAKAARAVVEGGGKVVAEEAMTMEKFNSLPASEMKKVLSSIKK